MSSAFPVSAGFSTLAVSLWVTVIDRSVSGVALLDSQSLSDVTSLSIDNIKKQGTHREGHGPFHVKAGLAKLFLTFFEILLTRKYPNNFAFVVISVIPVKSMTTVNG